MITNATRNINNLLKNGGKEKVLAENRHRLTPGDLSRSKPTPSKSQITRQKLDALRGKINGQ